MKHLPRIQSLSPRVSIITLAIVCLGLLGYVDWITGPNVALTCFYLIPVCLLTWFWGRSVGYAVSLMYAFIWLAIDGDNAGIQWAAILWNAAVRFVTFAFVVWLVHLCKNLSAEIERLVKARTEALHRELELRAEAASAIHRLANELSVAEDVERRRLGQELHESLGQSLSLLKLRLESLASQFPAGEPTASDLSESLALLSDVIRDSRTLTFQLYPPMLDQLGLTATLQNYAEQLAAQSRARIRVADFGPELSSPMAITSFLFRAVKELLTNSLKHGKAADMLVQIRRLENHIRIVVNDDGLGFPAKTKPSNGLGLAWIRERLLSLDGTLDIESLPGQGARVTIDVPVLPEQTVVEDSSHGQTVAR